jgi:hypothetical protein
MELDAENSMNMISSGVQAASSSFDSGSEYYGSKAAWGLDLYENVLRK